MPPAYKYNEESKPRRGKKDEGEDDKDDDDSSNDSSSSGEAEGEKIRVILKLAAECSHDESLKVPTGTAPIAVPATVGRQGLSAIVNHLLGRGIQQQKDDDDDDMADEEKEGKEEQLLPALNFEFIVTKNNIKNNRLLRTGLEREARQSGLSLEEAVEVTYFPAMPTPEPDTDEPPEPVPDWISTMAFLDSSSSSSLLFTGCYNGSIHAFSAATNDDQSQQSSKDQRQQKDEKTKKSSSLQMLTGKKVHSGPIKCLRATTVSSSKPSSKSNSVWIASGSMDHTLTLHQYQINNDNDDENSKKENPYSLLADCRGHVAAVSQVDLLVSSSRSFMVSGDWEGHICLWDIGSKSLSDAAETAELLAADEQASKKSKTLSSSKVNKHKKRPVLSPIVSLPAHLSQITGLSWGNHLKQQQQQHHSIPEELITASWDHSIKVWNLERQECLLTLNGSRVVTCLDTSWHSPGIVATGHPDCTIRLWDVRTSNNNKKGSSAVSDVVSDNTFRPSHKEWVSDVKWSPHDPYHLASTSHDGTIKLWDIRSSIPIHTVRAFPKASSSSKTMTASEKGLCLEFGNGGAAAAGGSSSVLLYAGGTDCIVKQFRQKKQ